MLPLKIHVKHNTGHIPPKSLCKLRNFHSNRSQNLVMELKGGQLPFFNFPHAPIIMYATNSHSLSTKFKKRSCGWGVQIVSCCGFCQLDHGTWRVPYAHVPREVETNSQTYDIPKCKRPWLCHGWLNLRQIKSKSPSPRLVLHVNSWLRSLGKYDIRVIVYTACSQHEH